MKKVSLFIAVILLMLCVLSACGTNNDVSHLERTNSTDGQMQNTTAPEATQIPSFPQNDDYPFEYRLTGTDIYINCPFWHTFELGYTQMFEIDGEQYLTATNIPDEEGISLEEAHMKHMEMLVMNLENEIRVQEINYEKEELLTVNDIQMYHFEGYFVGAYNEINHFTGYTFVMDGVPGCVVGVVEDPDQTQSVIDSNRATVDGVIQTLHYKR